MAPYIITDNTITIVIQGKALTMQSDHVNFGKVKEAIALFGNLKDDEAFRDFEDTITELFDQSVAVVEFAHGNLSVIDGQVIYKGEVIHNHVIDRMFAFMREGLPHKPILCFLDKLLGNPSRRAVQELYSFLEHKQMPLTPDGNFLAYKSIRSDWLDHHTGKFSNKIGSTLEMARNSVCDDASVGCSYGFHAGSLEYASHFGGAGSKMVIVEINPSDVVSVPTDSNCQKLRTTKYKVVGEYVRPLNESFNNDYYAGDDESYDDDAYDDDAYDDESSDYDKGYVEGLKQAARQKAASQRRDAKGKFV